MNDYTIFIPYIKGGPLMLLMCLTSISFQKGNFDVFVSANGEKDESVDFQFFKKLFPKNNLIINDHPRKRAEYTQQVEIYPKFLEEGRRHIIYCHEDVVFTKNDIISKIIKNTKDKGYTFHGKFHLKLNEKPDQSRYYIMTHLHYYDLERISKLASIADVKNWRGSRMDDNGHIRIFDSGFGRFAYYVYEEDNYLEWKKCKYNSSIIHVGGFTYRLKAKEKLLKVKDKIKKFIDHAESLGDIENTNFYKQYMEEYK